MVKTFEKHVIIKYSYNVMLQLKWRKLMLCTCFAGVMA